MNTIVYYVLSAGAACPGGACPQQVIAAPVQAVPAPVIIYQASPAALPWLAPRPPVIYVR